MLLSSAERHSTATKKEGDQPVHVYSLLPDFVGFSVNSSDTGSASVTGAGIRGVAAGLGVLATFALLGGYNGVAGHEALSETTIFETLVGGLLVVFRLRVAIGRSVAVVVTPKAPLERSGFGLFARDTH